MLRAWEAMRAGKDQQIAQLVELSKRFEQDSAEKVTRRYVTVTLSALRYYRAFEQCSLTNGRGEPGPPAAYPAWRVLPLTTHSVGPSSLNLYSSSIHPLLYSTQAQSLEKIKQESSSRRDSAHSGGHHSKPHRESSTTLAQRLFGSDSAGHKGSHTFGQFRNHLNHVEISLNRAECSLNHAECSLNQACYLSQGAAAT
jgi:hypothetical protein